MEDPMKPTIKRAVIVAALMTGGVLNAHADNDVWNNTAKYPRNDAELHAASADCAERFGAPDNGAETPRQHKRCMLGHGWRFSHTVRERTWIDPESGLTCRHSSFMDVPSSECSNVD
jgi:hypothetical protein